jgi:hypothetical protein
VALLLGYVAAGITYTFIPIVLAYPTGMLRGATQSPFFSIEMLNGVATFAGIIVLDIRVCKLYSELAETVVKVSATRQSASAS